MGFKQTSEGRVFFSGGDEQANDEEVRHPSRMAQRYNPAPLTASTPAPAQDSQTQVQIVTLLKALNERLKLTQAERNSMRKELDAYRDLIEELETKADRSERAYIELEQKMRQTEQDVLESSKAKSGGAEKAEELANEALKEMEETRRLLLSLEGKTETVDKQLEELKSNVNRHHQVGAQLIQKQSLLEETQKKHSKRFSEHGEIANKLVQRIKSGEERYEALNDKLEITATEQAKIGRKLDKAIEERARFMRKIERIEETVLQTRDSLNAKAMVLLTDQNVVGQPGEQEQYIDPQTLRAAMAAQQVDAAPANTPVKKKRKALKLNVAAYMNKTKAVLTSRSFILTSSSIALCAALIAAISYMPSIEMPKAGLSEQVEESASTPRLFSSQQQDVPGDAELASLQAQKDITDMSWKIEQEADQPDVSASMKPSSEANYNDDIGTLDLADEDQVQAVLNAGMDDAAHALNTIEPVDAPAIAEKTKPNVLQSMVDAGLRDNTALGKPADLMQPDASLEDVIKDIETQAFAGVAEAQHDLAAIYTAGHAGVKQDYDRARFWFEQAAARGVDNAAYNLGVMYHQGLGVKPDITKALDWYKIAADQGHPEAQYNLGIAYIEGIGVPYNPRKASEYFTNAANNNIMEAAYNLGLIQENGLLGQAKPDEALMWYKIAADQGSPEARQALEQLASSLNIKLSEVNRLAEGMKHLRKQETRDAISHRVQNTTPNPNLNKQIMVSQIQEHLMAKGLYPGPADGISGPLTQDAIRSYQRENAIPVTGEVSEDLLAHMAAHSGSSVN